MHRASSVPPQASTHSDLATDEGSVLGLLSILLKRWRMVVGLPALAAAVTLVVSLVLPAIYTANVSFVPEPPRDSRLPSGLAGLAGQFGISLGGEATQSPRFYVEVVKSRRLLERILLSYFTDPRQPISSSPDSVTLLHILGVKGRDASDSLQKGLQSLNELVSVRVDNQTHVVRVSVDCRYPTLAAAVANRVVAYVNDFNTQTRQSQARERRKFVEQRITDGERELRDAEEDLRTFYERNRSWQQAPQLVFEEGRRRRQVEIRQEVYLTLRREYETARIEEVNDTPVITVLDAAVPPSERSRPNRRFLVFGAIALGSIASVLLAFGGHYVERARIEDQGGYREFAGLMHGIRQQIARLAGSRRDS